MELQHEELIPTMGWDRAQRSTTEHQSLLPQGEEVPASCAGASVVTTPSTLCLLWSDRDKQALPLLEASCMGHRAMGPLERPSPSPLMGPQLAPLGLSRLQALQLPKHLVLLNLCRVQRSSHARGEHTGQRGARGTLRQPWPRAAATALPWISCSPLAGFPPLQIPGHVLC